MAKSSANEEKIKSSSARGPLFNRRSPDAIKTIYFILFCMSSFYTSTVHQLWKKINWMDVVDYAGTNIIVRNLWCRLKSLYGWRVIGVGALVVVRSSHGESMKREDILTTTERFQYKRKKMFISDPPRHGLE